MVDEQEQLTSIQAGPATHLDSIIDALHSDQPIPPSTIDTSQMNVDIVAVRSLGFVEHNEHHCVGTCS